MVKNSFISLWNEPSVVDIPQRVWRDWVLLAAAITATTVENVLRDPVDSRPLSILICVSLAFTLLWRRTHPFRMVALAFGTVLIVNIAILAGLIEVTLPYSLGYVVVLAYALFRWGSGRQAASGYAVMFATNVANELVFYSGPVESIFSLGFGVLPAAIGVSVRFGVGYRAAQRDQLRLREREQIARELHDTVAHHVSAIAVQAQAGQALAASQPKVAVEVLGVIEDAASNALEEMRLMVAALREDPTLAPRRGIEDIAAIVDKPEMNVPIVVRKSGDLNGLVPVVDAAIFRLAQESITNAQRHASGATSVQVSVVGDDDTVRLEVRDDGAAAAVERSSAGFGLVGMAERATLLGGTFEAGPDPQRGWTVTASVPKIGVASQ